MGKWLPSKENPHLLVSFLTGLVAVVLWCTNIVFNWWGEDDADQIGIGLLVLVLICVAIGFYWEGRPRGPENPSTKRAIGIACILLIICIAISIVTTGLAMGMDAGYLEETEDAGLGVWYGLRNLAAVTAVEVEGLAQWGLGLKTILKALFLIVPFLVATWGALSVLTADGLSDAEGGILSIVAAVIFAIIVWIFRLVDVSLFSASIGGALQTALGSVLTILVLAGSV